jgi:hypothetical protein
VDKGEFLVRLPKKEPGQHFDNLDLHTALLARRSKKASKAAPLIEVVGGDSAAPGPGQDEEFDWSIEQELPAGPALGTGGHPYGFDGKYRGILTRLQQNELPVRWISSLDCDEWLGGAQQPVRRPS